MMQLLRDLIGYSHPVCRMVVRMTIDLQAETTHASARLIKTMLRDLRYHANRLDQHLESAEELLHIAGTLSESVKKLSSVIKNEPVAELKKKGGIRIDKAAIRNFLEFSESLNGKHT